MKAKSMEAEIVKVIRTETVFRKISNDTGDSGKKDFIAADEVSWS